MATAALNLKLHYPAGEAVSKRDLLQVQTNVRDAFEGLPQVLNFVANAPASSTAPGAFMDAYLDSSGHLYICVATNTWRRFTGGTF